MTQHQNATIAIASIAAVTSDCATVTRGATDTASVNEHSPTVEWRKTADGYTVQYGKKTSRFRRDEALFAADIFSESVLDAAERAGLLHES